MILNLFFYVLYKLHQDIYIIQSILNNVIKNIN